MNNKGLITALIIIIILGGVIYFTLPQKAQVTEATGTTTTEETVGAIASPTSQSSSEEIIDFIVNDLTSDETKAAEATIDSTLPSSQSEVAASLQTNF